MGKSFVAFHDNGFWARDGLLEVWFRLMALNLPDDSYLESHWSRQIRDQWLFASSGMCNGWVSPNLDEYILDANRVKVLATTATKTINSLRAFGESLPEAFLNSLGIQGSFFAQPLVWYEEIYVCYSDLILGKLGWSAETSPVLPRSTLMDAAGKPSKAEQGAAPNSGGSIVDRGFP